MRVHNCIANCKCAFTNGTSGGVTVPVEPAYAGCSIGFKSEFLCFV